MFQKYLESFENLKEDNIDRLLKYVSENIIFIDPFHKVTNKKEMKEMLQKMFKKLENPNFKVLYYIKKSKINLVKWEFTCILFNKNFAFTGLSEVEIKGNLVTKHVDFWDSGKSIYCNLPLIGKIFRRIHG